MLQHPSGSLHATPLFVPPPYLCASLCPQDFTILVLLGAGCLSLGLELLVNRKAGGESSWIEGASILAAGALLHPTPLVCSLRGGAGHVGGNPSFMSPFPLLDAAPPAPCLQSAWWCWSPR